MSRNTMYIYLHTAVSLLFTGAANCFYNLFYF